MNRRNGTILAPVLVVLLLISIFAAGGFYILSLRQTRQPSLPTQIVQNSKVIPSILTRTLNPVYVGNYDVDVKISSDSPCIADTYLHSCKSDIYLRDKQSGKETYVLTSDNVVRNDSRIPQYAEGYIFLVKRVGYDEKAINYQGPWTDELWVYTDKDNGEKIYDSKGLTYNANQDGSLVALLHYTNNSPATNSAALLSRENNWHAKTYLLNDKQCKFSPDTPSSAYYLDLEKWQQNPSALWGAYLSEYRTVGCYWKLNPENSNVRYYPIPNSQILFALNTDKLVALYVDKPPFVEEISAKQWLSSHPTYSLYLYSLETHKSSKIATFPSDFKSVDIGWDSPTQLHFQSPKGREIYSMSGQ